MKKLFLIIIVVSLFVIASPHIFHKNEGESTSMGEYNKGSIKNSHLLPRKGINYKCHSLLSYYILGREYVHSKVYRSVVKTYDELYNRYPERKFIYMEAARKRGGRLYPHRTHQSGLSIDFMSPLVQDSEPKYYNALGIFRYLLNFDENGKLENNPEVEIDFNLMAEHILLLDKYSKENGLRIKKVILKIDLKDNLYNTENGKKLKRSGIYFARNLTPLLNKLHDDHYHVDFEEIN